MHDVTAWQDQIYIFHERKTNPRPNLFAKGVGTFPFTNPCLHLILSELRPWYDLHSMYIYLIQTNVYSNSKWSCIKRPPGFKVICTLSLHGLTCTTFVMLTFTKYMKITRKQTFAFYSIILEIRGEGHLSHIPALINFTFFLPCFPIISLASALFYRQYYLR